MEFMGWHAQAKVTEERWVKPIELGSDSGPGKKVLAHLKHRARR